MSLTNPNKIVTEERLNEYHQTILPYLGGMPDVLANKFSRADLYSTDEKMVGRWIDGKPLYQKVVQIGALTNAGSTETNKAVSVGASIDKYVNIFGVIYSGSSVTFIQPFPTNNQVSNAYSYCGGWTDTESSDTKNKVAIFYKGNMSYASDSYVIVQYTKTTDSPVEIGLDTDYSTTEKIIGTWIDGKPLYQKTWTGLNVSTGSSANAWINIVLAEPYGVDTFVNCMLYTDSGQSGSSLLINPIEVTRVDNSLTGFRCQIGSATDRHIIAATLQYTKTTD